MGLVSFALRRLLWMVPTLLGVSLIMFCLTVLIPGDPALLRLGTFATAEQLQSLRAEMGLDKPALAQYWLYLKGLARGDLGRSWRTGDTVVNDLKARFPATLELGLYSTLLSLVVGIPIGVITAVRRNSLLDYAGKLYGVIGVAMPLFWLGLILVYVFYDGLGIAPAPTGRIDMLLTPPPTITGMYVVDSLLAGDLEALWSSVSQLILPVLTLTFIVALGLRFIPLHARLVRGEVMAEKAKDHAQAARAIGCSDARLVWRHLLPNTLGPIVTQSTMNLSWAILNAAGLSFLGLGVQPPTPEWGVMISEGAPYIVSGQWWMSFFPGAALMLMTAGFVLIGDGINSRGER